MVFLFSLLYSWIFISWIQFYPLASGPLACLLRSDLEYWLFAFCFGSPTFLVLLFSFTIKDLRSNLLVLIFEN